MTLVQQACARGWLAGAPGVGLRRGGHWSQHLRRIRIGAAPAPHSRKATARSSWQVAAGLGCRKQILIPDDSTRGRGRASGGLLSWSMLRSGGGSVGLFPATGSLAWGSAAHRQLCTPATPPSRRCVSHASLWISREEPADRATPVARPLATHRRAIPSFQARSPRFLSRPEHQQACPAPARPLWALVSARPHLSQRGRRASAFEHAAGNRCKAQRRRLEAVARQVSSVQPWPCRFPPARV